MANVMTMSAAKKTATVINRIDPTDWFVGMKNPSVQLMVYGKGIRDAETVTTDYPGVTIDSLVRLDSPNYLLVYLNVKGAEAGTMTLKFDVKNEKGKVKSYTYPYVLKAREMDGKKRKGFDISDVLYMLMPDRFAQGANHRRGSTSRSRRGEGGRRHPRSRSPCRPCRRGRGPECAPAKGAAAWGRPARRRRRSAASP